MSELVTCDSCTKSESVWVTLLDDSVMCVSDLVDWGGLFRKYVTEYQECHGDESHKNTVAYIIGAVSAAVILIAGGSIFWLQKRRRERNRFKLIPYKRLGEEELADNVSIVTEISIVSDGENKPSTSSSCRAHQQQTVAKDEPNGADDIKPKAEPAEEAKIGAEAESGADVGAESGAVAKVKAEAGAKSGVKIENTHTSLNVADRSDIFFDSSDYSIGDEETDEDEELEAAAAAGKVMEYWNKMKKEI